MDVLFLANGSPGSAAGERAARVAHALSDLDVVVETRCAGRAADTARFAAAARRCRGVVYAVDLAATPVAAALARPRATRLVIDTGDAPSEFLQLVGAPGPARWAARLMELTAFRTADAFVVRGPGHRQLLQGRTRSEVFIVPDGVDRTLFRPTPDPELRRRLGMADVLTVGVQGHFTWYDSLGGGLGWELVRALGMLRETAVHGVLIGDGPGIRNLRLLADALDVADRLHVLGRIPYADLPRYLSLCDVCLLTQTDDPSSRVRTTGKLPCYLATGRFVLASRVGTAALLLPDEMLLDYEGSWDPEYPRRLATRLDEIAQDPEREAKGLALVEAAAQFDYDVVAANAAAVIRRHLPQER